MRQRWTSATAATLIVLVGGCAQATASVSGTAGAPTASPPPPAIWWDLPKQTAMPAAPTWREPAHYRFHLEIACNRGPTMGTYEVEVANGRIVGPRNTPPPTLAELFDRARDAKKSGGESVIVQDPTDGHPVIVTFNASSMGVDGATCYRISDYTATTQPPR